MSDAPKFFRIKYTLLVSEQWVRRFDAAVGVVQIGDRSQAGIFSEPLPDDLRRLQAIFGPVDLEPATFAEWVEQANGQLGRL